MKWNNLWTAFVLAIAPRFHRGTELYPRIMGADIKMFTNCRFGMMYWAVGTVCYAYAQGEREGQVSSSMMVS